MATTEADRIADFIKFDKEVNPKKEGDDIRVALMANNLVDKYPMLENDGYLGDLYPYSYGLIQLAFQRAVIRKTMKAKN